MLLPLRSGRAMNPQPTEPGAASPPAGDSDDELLLRMMTDDAQAFQRLVERHLDRAYALALRVVRNTSDAEDIAQDAFLQAWRYRHRWQPGRAKFTTWLYRVVMNRSIDLQRRPRNHPLDEASEVEDGQVDAVALIHHRQLQQRLEGALARLPVQQRVALTLSYYEDLGNADIARIMNTSVTAVEALLKRGRQRLRELLKGLRPEMRSP